MKFQYLEMQLSTFGVECLKNTIWNQIQDLQNHDNSTSDIQSLTTGSETTITNRMIEMAEKTVRDRERTENIRRTDKTKNITEWMLQKKQVWNYIVSNIEDSRSKKMAQNGKSKWNDSL